MWTGTRRLLALTLPSPTKALSGRLTNSAKLALTRNPHGSVAATLADCTTAALDALMTAAGGPAFDEAGFAALREAVRAELLPTVEDVLRTVEKVLTAWQTVSVRLEAETRPALAISVADMRAQLDRLVFPGFVAATGKARLTDLPRYLQALEVRLGKLPADPARDRLSTAQIALVQSELDDLRRRVAPSPELAQLRWSVEELRIGLFAQPMKTRFPVSDKRLYKAMDALLR